MTVYVFEMHRLSRSQINDGGSWQNPAYTHNMVIHELEDSTDDSEQRLRVHCPVAVHQGW